MIRRPTPYPTILDPDKAVECAKAYVKWHENFIGEVRGQLTGSEYDQLVSKARHSKDALQKVAVLINAKHGAFLQQKAEEDFLRGRIFKICFYVLLGGLALYDSFFAFEYTEYVLLAAMAWYFYRQTIAAHYLHASQLRLQDRVRELELCKIDLQATNPAFDARNIGVERLATVMLYTDQAPLHAEPIHGLIDLYGLPKDSHPTVKRALAHIGNYGANFEDRWDDPRTAFEAQQVVLCKCIVSGVSDSLRHKMYKAHRDTDRPLTDRNYWPTHYWDYRSFQRKWYSENGFSDEISEEISYNGYVEERDWEELEEPRGLWNSIIDIGKKLISPPR